MIKVKNISKKFIIKSNIVQALDNVSLQIEENDCFAIVGESGSGKTTLANIILGIYNQDSGEIWLEDRQLTSKRTLGLRKLIQFVQQNPMSTLNPKKTIYNTISLPLKIHKIVSNEKISERVEKLLSYVGLNAEFMYRYPDTLSGGQKQRVAIARALAMMPEVILFDEPTSALDPELIGSVLQTIRGLADEGMTMVIVTHEINFARDVADRIVYLDHGQVAEEGPSSIINDPKTERLQKFLSSMHEDEVPEAIEKELVDGNTGYGYVPDGKGAGPRVR